MNRELHEVYSEGISSTGTSSPGPEVRNNAADHAGANLDQIMFVADGTRSIARVVPATRISGLGLSTAHL